MSKRALSPSPLTASSFSSPSRPRQRRRTRFQLLHALPTALLTEVCSFLSFYQVVSTLRSTCHALYGSVTPGSLLRSHLVIPSRSLAALAASTPDTRTLVSRVPSLSLLYQLVEADNTGLHMALLPLQRLRSPLDASRFLFSSLKSLRVVFEDCVGSSCPPFFKQACLQDVMKLLAAEAASFSSLRRLHIHIDDMYLIAEHSRFRVHFSSLRRLSALTHLRLHATMPCPKSCWSLVSALTSMQSLTSLDMQNSNIRPMLLQVLCVNGATPLLLRLQTLLLPRHSDTYKVNTLYDAFLRRLSSLPAPPVLRHFSGVMSAKHSAAGLLSAFSLPHLEVLDVNGWTRHADFLAFVSGLTSAPAALISLVLPSLRDTGIDTTAALAADARALRAAVRSLLSRCTALRRLRCSPEMASGLIASAHNMPGNSDSCSASLYSLTVRQAKPACFPFSAPLSFPLLTELTVQLPLRDTELLELLLSACPQLLRLDCMALSWEVVLTAARYCGGLLELIVRVHSVEKEEDAVFAPPQPVASPFLPQLISLQLQGGGVLGQPLAFDLSVLQSFTAPPHSQLRRVDLEGYGLLAEHVLSLACLPRLSHLRASNLSAEGSKIAELGEARRRVEQQLLSGGAAGSADCDRHRPIVLRRAWEGSEHGPPLGPHQQQEMRQRVLRNAAAREWEVERDWLASVGGAEGEEVRALFFAELRSVLTSAAPSPVAGGRSRTKKRAE